jgi:hypothetical protein
MQIHIVCLPEELPVTETVELYRQLENEFGAKPLVYLNKMSQLTAADLIELNPQHRENLEQNLRSEHWARETLKAENISFTELPLVPSLNVNELIHTLSRSLVGRA